MQYRTLGRCGLVVSTQCLGTMTFGAEADESESHEMLDAFVEAGGNFVDCADVYSGGEAEAIVGRWLSRVDRDRIVLATKGRFPLTDDPNGHGASRAHLARALEASLRRLGVEHIDLYLLHAWDPATPVEETLAFFDDAVQAGKVHYVGVSNFLGWQLQLTALTARTMQVAPVVALQSQYNLLSREIEWEVVPVCDRDGIALLPWSPLGGGWLTGKYRREAPPTGGTRLGENPARGVEAYDRRNNDRTWRILDAMGEISRTTGLALGQVALAWVLERPHVASAVLGARSVDQLTESLHAADTHLDPGHRRLLDEVSEPPMPDYPYGFHQEWTSARASLRAEA